MIFEVEILEMKMLKKRGIFFQIPSEFEFVMQKLGRENFSALDISEKWEKIAPLILKDTMNGKMSQYLSRLFGRFGLAVKEDLAILSIGKLNTFPQKHFLHDISFFRSNIASRIDRVAS